MCFDYYLEKLSKHLEIGAIFTWFCLIFFLSNHSINLSKSNEIPISPPFDTSENMSFEKKIEKQNRLHDRFDEQKNLVLNEHIQKKFVWGQMERTRRNGSHRVDWAHSNDWVWVHVYVCVCVNKR